MSERPYHGATLCEKTIKLIVMTACKTQLINTTLGLIVFGHVPTSFSMSKACSISVSVFVRLLLFAFLFVCYCCLLLLLLLLLLRFMRRSSRIIIMKIETPEHTNFI